MGRLACHAMQHHNCPPSLVRSSGLSQLEEAVNELRVEEEAALAEAELEREKVRCPPARVPLR
jgi:hypothetical protein